ncbi:hypothetical protein D9613_008874 [Agrocybe pediades]|uniref:Phosphatidic acid phosphatase type 2/haloperoxidase domain-containing protein n=1 Tax=Agrocybe pediades TaxID=84607 RepID=A0A8H4VQN0_9AGAR|nr:hypothetical protein D9613_008874 [Agrocybe pediades]
MERSRAVQFSLSTPSSAASSRSSSPAPQSIPKEIPLDYDTKHSLLVDDVVPGQRGEDVYESTLSWWRAGLRRKLVDTVRWESRIIARMQRSVRSPWLDRYFVYSSVLGTHTFFMAILPTMFFFGYPEMGRGLVAVLGLGIYGSSVLKDLFCSPRPFAPPVTRLTIGSHHLEYGFPSTHSTNSVSIALIFFAHMHGLVTMKAISTEVFALVNVILFIYAFSVVYGRLYTAMHSFTDCVAGIVLGAGIWWAQTDWAGLPYLIHSTNPLARLLSYSSVGIPQSSGSVLVHFGKGLDMGTWVERWIENGGWEVPLILIPLCLLAVHHHPQPVDDCPCFEDAIAILSVYLGALVSRWAASYSGSGTAFTNVITPGSGWILEAGRWVQLERGWNDVAIWWLIAAAKMIVGILTIFVWRLLAKSALHIILPPTFRLLARVFRLPHRRFYTPATEYKTVPSEFHSPGDDGVFGLHPIPSVIDLPSAGGVGFEVGGIGSGVEGATYGDRDLKIRPVNGNGTFDGYSEKTGNVNTSSGSSDQERLGKDGPRPNVKHYDADVLTKVIVYAGIAILATEILPFVFDALGWGVRSWPLNIPA